MLLPAPKMPSLVMNKLKLSPQATSSTLRPLSKKKLTRLICWTLSAIDAVLPPVMTVELGIPYYPQWLSPRVKTTPSSVRMNMWDAPKISFFTRQSSKAECALRVIFSWRPLMLDAYRSWWEPLVRTKRQSCQTCICLIFLLLGTLTAY